MATIQGNPEYKDSMEGLAREPATPEIFNKRYQILLNNDTYMNEKKSIRLRGKDCQLRIIQQLKNKK